MVGHIIAYSYKGNNFFGFVTRALVPDHFEVVGVIQSSDIKPSQKDRFPFYPLGMVTGFGSLHALLQYTYRIHKSQIVEFWPQKMDCASLVSRLSYRQKKIQTLVQDRRKVDAEGLDEMIEEFIEFEKNLFRPEELEGFLLLQSPGDLKGFEADLRAKSRPKPLAYNKAYRGTPYTGEPVKRVVKVRKK